MSTFNKPRILYFGRQKTLHDVRFLNALEELGHVVSRFLPESEIEISPEWLKSNVDLIVGCPLSDALNSVPSDLSIPILGISLAYDVNEEAKEPLKKIQIQANIQKLETIIVDCDYVRKKIQEEFDFKKTIVVIPYGCDFDFFSTIEIDPVRKLNILVTRNWSDLHGNSIVLEALRILADEIDFSASFLGGGDTFGETKEEFEDLINNQKVKFYGYASRESLYAQMAANWCYVSAARSDGSSVSLLEAMSAGRVCVTSDFPSNREWIKDGVSGFTFRNGDAHDLATTLSKVSKIQISTLKQIGLRAREVAEAKGNWGINKGKFIGAAEQSIESRNSMRWS